MANLISVPPPPKFRDQAVQSGRFPRRSTVIKTCSGKFEPPQLFTIMSADASSKHGCQMAIAGFLDRMCLTLLASGLWLRYAALQNLNPSFPWIAPPRPPPWGNPRKGRDQILPSGNLASKPPPPPPPSLMSLVLPKDQPNRVLRACFRAETERQRERDTPTLHPPLNHILIQPISTGGS